MERFLDYFVPESYDLDLDIDKNAKTLCGVATITGSAKSETIKLHAVNLTIENVKINGKNVKFSHQDGILSVSEVSRSSVRIRVGYHTTLNENMQGAYLSTYQYKDKTETIVATQFESHYAREAFPCIDEPAAKAIFSLALTTPDNGDIVLANTKVAATQKTNGKITYTFEPTPKMSTYLLAWVIGKFQKKTIKNQHSIEISTYAAMNQDPGSVDFANEVAAKSLDFYADNFGVDYPLTKLDQVALPDFEAGAMENWGLVTYRETALLAGKNTSKSSRKYIALVVAHELSHQWFGDLVTMQWWDELWLNESFASIIEYFAVDALYPNFHIFEDFFTSDALSALRRDAHFDVQPIQQDVSDPEEISTLFDPSIVYSKGARLMLMVIRAMGWDHFCAGLKDYFEKHAYGNTIGSDLWQALSRHTDLNIAELMKEYIEQPGFPVITRTNTGFTQQRFLLDTEMSGTSSWILPEITEDMSGHYIVNLTEKEFSSRLDKFGSLTLEEKLRLLIDRSLLAKTNLVSPSTLVPLIQKFQSEPSSAVWGIIATIIGDLKIFFDPDSESETNFKNFVARLVSRKLEEIGLFAKTTDDENTTELRGILLSLALYAESKDSTQTLADAYSSDFTSIHPEDRSPILSAKIRKDPEIWDEYFTKYQSEPDPEIKSELLAMLTISKAKENIAKALTLLEKSEIVKPQDQFILFIYLFRNSAAKNQAFDWLITHWNYVAKIIGEKSLDNYPRYMATVIRTKEDAAKYHDFFAPQKSNPLLSRAITIGESEIKSTLARIAAEKTSVQRAIKFA